MNNPWQFGGFRSLVEDVNQTRRIRGYARKVPRWTAEDEANLAKRVARMAAQKPKP